MSACCSDFPNCKCCGKNVTEAQAKEFKDFINGVRKLPGELEKKEPKQPKVITYDVPDGKWDAVKAFERTLRTKFPKMKPARIGRKVADHFKLKPIIE